MIRNMCLRTYMTYPRTASDSQTGSCHHTGGRRQAAAEPAAGRPAGGPGDRLLSRCYNCTCSIADARGRDRIPSFGYSLHVFRFNRQEASTLSTSTRLRVHSTHTCQHASGGIPHTVSESCMCKPYGHVDTQAFVYKEKNPMRSNG